MNLDVYPPYGEHPADRPFDSIAADWPEGWVDLRSALIGFRLAWQYPGRLDYLEDALRSLDDEGQTHVILWRLPAMMLGATAWKYGAKPWTAENPSRPLKLGAFEGFLGASRLEAATRMLEAARSRPRR